MSDPKFILKALNCISKELYWMTNEGHSHEKNPVIQLPFRIKKTGATMRLLVNKLTAFKACRGPAGR